MCIRDRAGTQVVFVEGAANLVTGQEDRRRLQEMLKTLEEKEKVAQLLGAYLDVKQEAVRVVIGLDDALPSMQNFVLIGAPARSGTDMFGSLAVIGPTRMDYQPVSYTHLDVYKRQLQYRRGPARPYGRHHLVAHRNDLGSRILLLPVPNVPRQSAS